MLKTILRKLLITGVSELHNSREFCSQNEVVEYNAELSVLFPVVFFFLSLSFSLAQAHPIIPACLPQVFFLHFISTPQTQVKYEITHRPNKNNAGFWLGSKHSMIFFTSPLSVYLPNILLVCLFRSKCLLFKNISNNNLNTK